MSDLTLALFKNLNYNFVIDNNATTKEFVVFRTKFHSPEEVHSFVQELQKLTNTNFISIYKKNLTRKVYHKRWICHHSKHRKKPGSKKNTGCKSFIDVVIKKVNENTKRKDPFLKGEELLPCIIRVNLEHTHSTENGDVLKLSVIPDIRKRFEEYFENGLSVCEARRFHECQLTAHWDYNILTNSAFNPTERQAYYLYDKWRAQKNSSTLHGSFRSKENLRSYEYKGTLDDLQNISSTDWISSLKLDYNRKSSTDFMNEPCYETSPLQIEDVYPITNEDETNKQKKQPMIDENESCSYNDSSEGDLETNMDCSFSSSGSSSVESTPKTYSKINEKNIGSSRDSPRTIMDRSFPMPNTHKTYSKIINKENTRKDVISDQKSFTRKEHFTFKRLQENISLIRIPNNLWGISLHSNVVICARWNEDYTCSKKVVIEKSLNVKAFLNEWEINLSEFMSITCIEDISNMLEKVESSIKHPNLK